MTRPTAKRAQITVELVTAGETAHLNLCPAGRGDSMYNETNVPGPEYRVRAVTRHVVTKYFHPYQSQDGRSGCAGSSQVIGEFDNAENAAMVASALAGSEEGSTVSL